MSTKGQTINDRFNAAKYTLAGQALARCICKATTEELMRPKKKHLDYLAACTYESNVSMLQLTNMLIERTNHSNWAVVYKSLITVHHLMSFGSERFTQYLASSNYSFQLSGFLDRIVAKGYAMSTFIRRYSNYINQKALSYRTMAVDLCRTQRGEDNILRTMPIERLLETLPIIQKQLDILLDFGCTANDLNNGIITASFTLLFHDSIRLFASYNDGIINLFEKYFDLNKKMCREAFEAYKKFLACTDRVAEFLKVGEAINLDRGEIPDFKRAPSSLLDALEQHLISLESNNKKRGDKVVIDTKFATFPSFTAQTSLDFSPPQMATMAIDFDSKLSFAQEETSKEGSNDLVFNTSNNNNKIDFSTTITNGGGGVEAKTTSNSESLSDIILQPPQSSLISKTTNSANISATTFDSATNDDFNQLKLTSSAIQDFSDDAFGIPTAIATATTITSLPKESASIPQQQQQQQLQQPQSTNQQPVVNNDLFDLKPPGYSGGLLTPEPTLQIKIDPSIDPHTQQQLIQIQREQAANKYKQQHNYNQSASFSSLMSGAGSNSSSSVAGGVMNNNRNMNNNNNNSNTNNNYSSIRSTNSNRAKQESIFEDLEQTMRQSLHKKVEKA